MTLEEKRKAIKAYCEDEAHDCSEGNATPDGECPLFRCTGRCFRDGADIDRNYAIMAAAGVLPASEATPDPRANPVHEFDPVNRPKHYNREGAMESIEEMELILGREAVMHFCLCNVLKYRYRAASKNGEEDLKKSDWYMRKYKELKEAGHDPT